MAIALENKQNVTAPGGGFPYGDVKDNDGSNNGTPLNRAVLSDYIQFFAKILDESGISANGLLENDTNGWQYYDAIIAIIRATSASLTEKGSIEIATQTEVNTGTDNERAITPLTLATRIAALVDSAPATLDTLNELAAALGDDPNFATTITNLVATAQATADLKLDIALDAWTLVPNSTVGGDTYISSLYWRVDDRGQVFFKGFLENTVFGGTSLDTFGTLPAAARPDRTIAVTGVIDDGVSGDPHAIFINSSGVMNGVNIGVGNVLVFDGVTYLKS